MPQAIYIIILATLLLIIAALGVMFFRVRRQYKTQATINYFTTSLFGKNRVDEILWDIAKNCISQLQFEDCVIYLFDEQGSKLVQKAAYGAKNPEKFEILNPIEIPLGTGIVGSVALSGKSEIIHDTSQDKRYIVDDQQRYSELTVPIFYEGKVIGIIDSEHHKKHFYTEHHRFILEQIAAICSAKLAKTFAETKANLQDIEVQKLHKQLAELRLITLKSQVNPHFLFNCLNGIYNCIIQEQVDKAGAYVSHFAKLLRTVLMHAEKNFISLQEENEMIEYYLGLESLRADNNFQYEIKLADNIDPHTFYVPGMLIQPFLENAIWHGLMNKEGDRRLKVLWLQPEDNTLLCEITDNGIGRKLAGQNRTQTLKHDAYKSKGMMLCMERVELYKSLFNTDFSIEIEDLYNDEMPAGTKVSIKICRNDFE